MFYIVVPSSTVSATGLETSGDITYFSTEEGYIHFDNKGNIIDSNLPINETQNNESNNFSPNAAINHASGRWVYYSERYDWLRKRRGSSNHYSFEYSRHGSKAQVGGDIKYGRGTLKTWAYATANGKSSDTFKCWYNPTAWY